MKLKSWVLWLLVAVFLASEIFLFSATQQKNTAMAAVSELKQKNADLQAQIDTLKNSSAATQTAEIARLRAEALDLPRLRNQVTQLQAENKKLSTLFQNTLNAAQTQQERLQQLAAENQQARAEAQQSDAIAERNTCINHLRQIDAAKNQWALENNKTADAVPTATDIAPYIKLDANGNIPGCPSGGAYVINAVSLPPTCSVPGHVLP